MSEQNDQYFEALARELEEEINAEPVAVPQARRHATPEEDRANPVQSLNIPLTDSKRTFTIFDRRRPKKQDHEMIEADNLEEAMQAFHERTRGKLPPDEE